jgi:transcriptional regulator with XRE-family HTH domain
VHKEVLCHNIMRFLALRRMQKKDLATKAGVSISFISDVTNAKGNPSLETMAAIAKALDVTVSDLTQTPRPGEDEWDESLADIVQDDSRIGLPRGFRRVAGIVTEFQALEFADWTQSARERMSAARKS